MNPPSILAHEAAISIGQYCSTRFQVAGTDNDVHPMLDIPWFAEAVQKAIDEGAAENARLVAKIADLERNEALNEAACESNGFGLCLTHPPCDLVRATQRELWVKVEGLERELKAERAEWNDFCGLKRPEGSPPLTPKDARLMRAIFASD